MSTRLQDFPRTPWEVQDPRCAILSEKTLPVPELGLEVQARKGFNVIATANDRDKGVNELSSALKRRFNTVVLPLPDSIDDEVDIVRTRGATHRNTQATGTRQPALSESSCDVTSRRAPVPEAMPSPSL